MALVTAFYTFADEASDYAFILVDKPVASASSVLEEPGKDKNQYSPVKAFDNKKETSWCEGKSDDGIGESIEVKFKPTILDGIRVGNGVLIS